MWTWIIVAGLFIFFLLGVVRAVRGANFKSAFKLFITYAIASVVLIYVHYKFPQLFQG